MKARVMITLLALTVGLAVLTGCESNNNEWQRLVCEVESLNGGAPLVSAYLNSGNDRIIGTEDDYYPIDFVPVLFKARALNNTMVIPENGTYSWFHITGYDLTWHPGVNAPAELTNYNVRGGLAEAVVPVNDEGMVSVLVADRSMKEEVWFRQLFDDLLDPEVPATSFSAFLEFTFYGHESSSEHIVAIPAGMAVTFYGAVSSN